MATFSLSWNTYKQNICSGLSSLQQNGEFVDMTLAADGHHVKVHQLVMSLISPYIKELISSAQCPHPIIFLNNISYTVLCSILEYIYTGEVLVSQDNLEDLINAAKQLHIQGLKDMNIDISTKNAVKSTKQSTEQPRSSIDIPDTSTDDNDASHGLLTENVNKMNPDSNTQAWNCLNKTSSQDMEVSNIKGNKTLSNKSDTQKGTQISPETQIQYTLSNQGSVQLILNRYIYNVRYTSRRGANGRPGYRMWRCSEYRVRRCPAALVTQDDVVIKRHGVHNHPFHDKNILRKVRDKLVFYALGEAEKEGSHVKETKTAKQSTTSNENIFVASDN